MRDQDAFSTKRLHDWGNLILWYRCGLALALALVYPMESFIKVRLSGQPRILLGYGATLLLFALITEFGALVFARLGYRLYSQYGSARLFKTCVIGLTTILLASSLMGHYLYGYIFAPPYPQPHTMAVAAFGAWLVFACVALRGCSRTIIFMIGFCGLVLVTRALAYYAQPFDMIQGDMLQNIKRCLQILFMGRFPYIDVPPPAMPYWPLTFLSYALPQLVGWDLRVSNVVVELATVMVAMSFGIKTPKPQRELSLAQVALPLFLLHPTWVFFSANTQYAVSVLTAILFARAVTSYGAATQAITLGIAVATNQTFGVFGFFIAPYWIKHFGLRRSCLLASLAFLMCLLLISPFLLWNPGEFLRVSIVSLKPFGTDQLAGGLTLRPLVEGLFPYASAIFIFIIIGLFMLWIGYKCKTPTSLVVAISLGYCLCLMLLHRTFMHYYLPVIAMVIICSEPGEQSVLLQNHSRDSTISKEEWSNSTHVTGLRVDGACKEEPML